MVQVFQFGQYIVYYDYWCCYVIESWQFCFVDDQKCCVIGSSNGGIIMFVYLVVFDCEEGFIFVD